MSKINKTPVLDALNQIRRARQMMEMRTMSVHPPDGSFTVGAIDQWSTQVRETTRLWRETWVNAPLDQAIATLEKELAK